MRAAWTILCVVLMVTRAGRASDVSASQTETSHPWVRYKRDKGLVFETPEGATSLWLGLRLQLRYSDLPGSPVDPATLPSMREQEFSLNRARIKGGGQLFHPSLQVYSEYDFEKEYLLDLRATIEPPGPAAVRIGQWKTEYNRERVDSSGKQQFTDRSVANYWFTLDRQLGAEVQGHMGEQEEPDISYWLACVSGEGRGGGWDDGDGLGMLRCQWNALGGEAPFSQSDIKRRESPLLAFALGCVHGTSRFTRFSSSGGGQLPGYEDGDKSQYRLTQLMQDSIFHAGGFSWQQELHWKEVDDRPSGAVRELWGGYAQAGCFVDTLWEEFPEPLELAIRCGAVDPDRSRGSDWQQEYTFAVNWFFNKHRNKLTADTSYLDLDDPDDPASEWRVRVQWDVSF